MNKLNTIFKVLMVVLILVSVAILVLGFTGGWSDQSVELLLKWTYAMVGIALVAALAVGIIINAMNDPKSLVKMLLGLVGVAAVCAVAYVLAPGSPCVGLIGDQPEASTLKITDTVLNLTYLAAGLAIVSIVIGEIVMAIRNK